MGHGPLNPIPGQGELCPPRDAQAESSGKDPQLFQILMERLSAASPRHHGGSRAGGEMSSSFPQENDGEKGGWLLFARGSGNFILACQFCVVKI